MSALDNVNPVQFSQQMTADNVLTHMRGHATTLNARNFLDTVPRALQTQVADKLYVEHKGRGAAGVRHRIVTEARAHGQS